MSMITIKKHIPKCIKQEKTYNHELLLMRIGFYSTEGWNTHFEYLVK